MANLLDQTFIGKFIDRSFVKSFPAGVDVCGENGEYHTFCFGVHYSNIPFRLPNHFLYI
jgi:diphthamide synthase (EF-2-diphthine--ammonia ligase)